jgi:hypothetical protein
LSGAEAPLRESLANAGDESGHQAGGTAERVIAMAVGTSSCQNSKAKRIETMKGPAESGQICSVGRKKNSEENSEK